MASSPSYLYRNRCGIYCFQRRIPKAFRLVDTGLPAFVRLSLATTSRKEALRRARKMTVRLDEIMKDHFDSAEGFSNAMALFYRYCEAKSAAGSWNEFQESFLDRLDDETSNDSELLERAIAYKAAEAKAFGASASEVTAAGESLEEMFERALGNALLNQEAAKSTSIPLTEAFSKFIEANKLNWKASGDTEMKFTVDTFPLVLELFGRISTGELAIQHAALFKQAVSKMPSNRHKRAQYRDLTISEILNIDIPESDQLSRATQQKYVTRFGSFLAWLKANGYIHRDLDQPLKRAIKLGGNPRDERLKYSNEDLKRLFNSRDYVQGTHDAPYKYWVPLIALYTGARINEICQLMLTDVYQQSELKIWVFDINETNSEHTQKSLKRPYHSRLVPVHKELIRLGFIEFVCELKKQGEIRLFPELPYNGNKNKFANKAMRWFNNTYTNALNCNIQTPKTSFHSIRHSVLDYLQKIGKINLSEWAELFGQLAAGNEGQRRYAKSHELPEFEQCINKINFNHCLDAQSIRPWTRQEFAKRLIVR